MIHASLEDMGPYSLDLRERIVDAYYRKEGSVGCLPVLGVAPRDGVVGVVSAETRADAGGPVRQGLEGAGDELCEETFTGGGDTSK